MSIAENITKVRKQIREAAQAFSREPAKIHLLAVSKTKPASAIREAYACQITDFGENYLQEALTKQQELNDLKLTWHFIGPIQSNKTKLVAENFTWVHSVDRLKIAERLSSQRPEYLPDLNICLQVNISNEDSKSGCAPEQLVELARQVSQLPRLKLRGLMAIPAPCDDYAEQQHNFAQVRQLLEQIIIELNLPLDTLSMGMTHDLQAAVAQGSTWLRIGTAIFGERQYNN